MSFVGWLRNSFGAQKNTKTDRIVSEPEGEPERTLRELAASGHTFWKFSQSDKNGKSAEHVYAGYVPGEYTIAHDTKGLSFVEEKNIGHCWMYGDRLTKLCFDLENPKFQKIADNNYHIIGSALGELETRVLLTEENYSLGDPETITMIIKMSNNMALMDFLLSVKDGFADKLQSFGFEESAELLRYIEANYSYVYADQLQYIRDNIDAITHDFETRRSDEHLSAITELEKLCEQSYWVSGEYTDTAEERETDEERDI